ncbi:MAG: TetR/AcrR family transcriptional regulator [Clostridia bacterium]|nr:TetR/AcrR family transcriptional regulator [Clostridia bacterium]
MYHIKDDKRAQGSADLLTEALKRLMLAKEPRPLTIALLCREAGISRTTFYRLFDTPDDVIRFVLDRRFRDLFQDYAEQIARAKESGASVPSPTRRYAEAFLEQAPGIAGLIRNGKLPLLQECHKKAMRDFAPALFPDMDPTSDEFVFFVDMRTAVLTGAVTAWVETGQRATVEEVERYAARQLKYLIDE